MGEPSTMSVSKRKRTSTLDLTPISRSVRRRTNGSPMITKCCSCRDGLITANAACNECHRRLCGACQQEISIIEPFPEVGWVCCQCASLNASASDCLNCSHRSCRSCVPTSERRLAESAEPQEQSKRKLTW
ncbi:hypothetical protein BDW02DRAFT_229001 [Decorospora gaudefroyi]|uniref:Uncharacterized protein n=1 Tax=Decorospora gaudefroyi TaxID=184978 RepID=A0A6A5KZ57_9PLEO|nr:hypothetical protein BDW02DRAFT_229001 [Decorospora gaudefroyi]